MVTRVILLCLWLSSFALSAQEIERTIDDMTPDEIAEVLGIPQDPSLYPEIDPFFHQASTGFVQIDVSIANQSYQVLYPGGGWSGPISSGKPGFGTKRGCFRIFRVEGRKYNSVKYKAPMPYPLFYFHGFAIHGTFEERKLGRPASRGCVRIAYREAEALHAIVGRYGMHNTVICVR